MSEKNKKLPVFVVDDHNEVLPYIHQSIGSKQLPFSGVTIVHFDAHPDLLVPNYLKAADIFDKQCVYNSVSIATWMVPLLYAGHVSTVVWVKPPWAQQIDDGTYMFWVGECRTSGYIRLSCKINYFLSEGLYAPQEELVNKRKVTLITVTLQPSTTNAPQHSTASSCTLPYSKEAATETTTSDLSHMTTVEHFSDGCHNLRQAPAGDQHSQNHHQHQTMTITGPALVKSELEGPSPVKKPRSLSSLVSNQVEKDLIEGDSTKVHSTDSVRETSTKVDSTKVHSTDSVRENSTKVHSTDSVRENSTEVDSIKENSGGAKLMKENLKKDLNSLSSDTIGLTSETVKYTVTKDLRLCLERVISSIGDIQNLEEGFILDIDLDFYSTKNPFLEMFSKSQYRMLKELYHFTEPKQPSNEAVKECVERRIKQLQELERIFQKLDRDPGTEVDKSFPRRNLLLHLVHSLQETTPGQLDFLLLHDAGCTCDDTELPHHVSSAVQIDQLIECTGAFLSQLPKPKLVTIARSVSDEYCPPEQVEEIQEGVVSLLGSCYGQTTQLVRSYE